MLKVPLRWTAITSSKSCSLMETSIRSRRIPALFTTTWRSPKEDTAWSTMAFAPSNELTLSVLATAWPPAAVISSTTDCAAETSAPEPSTAPPRSLTTTLAPKDANRRACSRPMPRPPPVMIATLSCNMVSRPLGSRPRPRDGGPGETIATASLPVKPASGRRLAPAALQVATLRVRARQVVGLPVGLGRLGAPAEAAQHVATCRRQEVVVGQLGRRDPLDQGQPCIGSLRH